MEANFFRFAAAELSNKIQGTRIAKIYMPGPSLYTLDLGRVGYLIWACSRKQGFFYLSQNKPPNPSHPPSYAMWLRKRAKNTRIQDIKIDWVHRRMALAVTSREAVWLVLDIRNGVQMLQELDAAWDKEASWPEWSQIQEQDQIWESYPQLSPPLRKELSIRDPDDSKKLLNNLKLGVPEGFLVCKGLRGGSQLSCFRVTESRGCQDYDSALEAAEIWGANQVEGFLYSGEEAKQEKQQKKYTKKLEKRLDQVQKDRQRLEEMVAQEEKARLIQANLYQLSPGQKTDELKVSDPVQGEQRIALDRKLTVQENMEQLFQRAAKGKRGLRHVEERERELTNARAENSDACIAASDSRKKAGEIKHTAGQRDLYRKARIFLSSDGFQILRAKNSRVARDLLRENASSQDLWLHVQDGPGAHVVLKRGGKNVQVPETSLEEAAILAALSSYQKHEHKGRVMCALVRDVRPIKGGAPGQVIVDRVHQTLVIPLDADLETRLRVD